MAQTVEGIYRNGKIELLDAAPVADEARVIVTFLPANAEVDLTSRQIGPEQAQSLRARLKAFDADWRRPDMDAYDAL